MTRARAVLAAALVAVANVRWPARRRTDGAATATGTATTSPSSALVFSKTAAFRHDSIPAGVAAIRQLGARHHFTVDATEDAAAFTDANLARYDVGGLAEHHRRRADDAQQAAFERYIRAGGGYAGIHSASDTEYDWAWYGGLVGAYFRDHPGLVNPQFQVATVKVSAAAPLPPAVAAPLGAGGGVVQLPHQPAGHRAGPRRWTSGRTTRAATASPAGRRGWAGTIRSPGASRTTGAAPSTPRWGTGRVLLRAVAAGPPPRRHPDGGRRRAVHCD